MTNEDIGLLAKELLAFITHVVEKNDATPAEVEALPKVASVLVEISRLP